MDLIVLDGLDNTGKTWTINEVQKECIAQNIKSKTVHFPSKELCNSDVFKELVKPENKYNEELKMDFVRRVVEEEREILLSLKEEGCDLVLIDRFLISTIIYQGESIFRGWNMENKIIEEYDKMLSVVLDEDFHIHHFIFIPKIQDDDRETNDTKLKFDSMYNELHRKLWAFIVNLINIDPEDTGGKPFSKYLNPSTIRIFNEDVFYQNIPLTREILDKLTEDRVDAILTQINIWRRQS